MKNKDVWRENPMINGVITHDGIRTRTYHWPVAKPRQVVQIVHGMAEHAGRYDELAQFLNSNDIAVVAHDHRGHGPEAVTNGPLGHFADENGWSRVVEDISLVRTHFQRTYPDVPWIMLGHSMGSFATRDYLTRGYQPLAGAILVGTGRWPCYASPGLLLASALAARKPRCTAHLLNTLVFAGYNKGFERRTNVDWLCSDPAVVDSYRADPLCGFVPTNQFFADFLSAHRRVNTRATFSATPRDLPILVVSGAKDPVGGASGATQVANRYDAAGVDRVSAVVYPGKRHEILQETNKQQVYEDLLLWITTLC
ncbi:alpha/beta hydrolase [Corynebacterium sp. TAE3-ERU2]|uniref:alpha/beta hydrolase n=1 Tax=Corynebacterium sp. TAE3-ERU2 TaxID=2849497 RepID=UPI001C497AE2|nr:lysophospholipase [Corynebacterium sp. TAE3-ERU2]